MIESESESTPRNSRQTSVDVEENSAEQKQPETEGAATTKEGEKETDARVKGRKEIGLGAQQSIEEEDEDEEEDEENGGEVHLEGKENVNHVQYIFADKDVMTSRNTRKGKNRDGQKSQSLQRSNTYFA